MERARIDGIELEYEVAGNGEPVLLIHGALVADAFRPLVLGSGLAQTYTLVNMHRRGYAGSSRLTESLPLADQAADCLALLRHLEIPRAHVVGHSLGAAIALQLTRDAPEAVHTLALLEPAMFVGESAASYRASLEQGMARAREAGAAAAVDGFLEMRWHGYRRHLDRLVPGGFDQAARDANELFAFESPGWFDWQFGPDEARAIRQPVLSVLGGENDKPGTRFQEVHRFLLETMPNSVGVVLPGMEHMMHMQDPLAVAAVLAGFWERHPLTAQ